MAYWLASVVLLLFARQILGQVNFCEKISPRNEIFSKNVSQCQNTCFNSDFDKTPGCANGPGFACKNRFVRHQETYACIPVENCSLRRGSKHCPSNEYFSDCGCFRSCENKNVQCKQCVSGCTCRTGYIRSSVNSQCIPENQCQSCPSGYKYSVETKRCLLSCNYCRDNEVFKTCGSCEPTCKNPKIDFCSQQCKDGCFCNRGLLRDTTTGNCVIPNNCPRETCPENESFVCRSPKCERYCYTIGLKCAEKTCKFNCYCDPGYVRAFEGSQCVPESHCPIINNSPNNLLKKD